MYRDNITPISGFPGGYMAIPTHERVAAAPESPLNQLLRLDSSARPGLSDAEFSNLFAKCRCGLIMTRRVFVDHLCAIVMAQKSHVAAIIDLTSDNGDCSGNISGGQNVIDLTMEDEV